LFADGGREISLHVRFCLLLSARGGIHWTLLHPLTVIIGLVVVILAMVFAWSGMSVAWGLVILLAFLLVLVLALWVWSLPRWPG
jgi:hypothetical protein